MAQTYWLTFRIHDDAGYDDRRESLYKEIDTISDVWWVEPTSFVLFRSDQSMAQVCGVVSRAINPNVDLVVVGMPEYKSMRTIGELKNYDALAILVPFVKQT
jgi:hypothetical protein